MIAEIDEKKLAWVVEEVEVGVSIAVYSACSVAMVLLNKLVMDTHKINFPMGLLFCQNLTALILVVVVKWLGFIQFPDFDWKIVRKWLPLTVLFVTMLWTSMESLRIMSVAVSTVLKNLSIVLIALGDQYFYGKRISKGMYFAFSLMVLGSYLTSVGDQWVTVSGLFWTFANVFATVAYVLYMKHLVTEVGREIGRYGPVFYNNLLSLPFIFPACFETLPDLVSSVATSSAGTRTCFACMLVVGSIITFASFWCMKMTSPTTYSVTGALNKIPLALLGVFIFSQVPRLIGWVGIFLALGGGVVYTWVSRQPVSTPAETERRQ